MFRFRAQTLAPFAITAFPLLPLLEVSRVYHADWLNHGWLMDYYGQYVAAHGWFPRIVNTQQIAGLALPLFYGHLMYAVGGIFASVLGGDLGIRAVVALLLLWQCFCVRDAVRIAGGGTAAANVVAALAGWTIYPLTNLFNRGAVTEFFAVAGLTCAVCFLLNLTVTTRSNVPWSWIFGLALSYSLATVHPITAAYGGLLLGFIWLVAVAFSSERRNLLIAAACCVPICVLILAPQLYMLAHWGSSLRIALSSASIRLRYLPSDFGFSRLAPFPFDIASLRAGANLETAYLDSQLNFPLLILAAAGTLQAAAALRSREARLTLALISFGWAVLVASFLLSVFPSLALPFGAAVNRLQYAYRLVSYQDLALLVIAICLIRIHVHRSLPMKPWMLPLCAATLAVAFVATIEKWTHASASPRPTPIGHSQQTDLTLPYTFYSPDDYTSNFPEAAAALPRQSLGFPIAAGTRFGEAGPAEISAALPVLVVTNVSAFAPNRIVLDGVAIPSQQMQRSGVTFAFGIPPGHHTLESRFEPGSFWLILRAASEGLFFAVAALYLWLAVSERRLARPAPSS